MPASFNSSEKGKGRADGRYATDIRTMCQFCQKEWDPRGLTRHQKLCKARYEEEAFYEENRKRAAEVDLQTIPKRGRPGHQADPPSLPSRFLHEPLNNGGGNFDESRRNPANFSSTFQNFDGPPVADDTDPFERNTTNNPFQLPPPAPTVATPEPSLPNRDDIRVEYHRNSGRPTLTPIYAFEDYKREKNKVDPKLLSDAAWRPFNTRLDFEVAEFAHKTHLSEPSLARLLDLFRRGTGGKEMLTFATPADVYKAWDRANIYHVPFAKTSLEVEFEDKPEPFEFHRRSLWDWIIHQVKDPLLAPHFEWDAQRLSKFDGQEWVRFYDEPWTGDMFSNVQTQITKINPEGKPLSIILWADTAKLSTFGTQKGHFIVARIGNLPSHIRNGGFLGGGRIVGFIPVADDDPKHRKKPKYVNFKNAVYHEAFREFLKDVAEHSKAGYSCKCGDEILRHIFPFINIISADYEEQVRFALLRGLNGLAPCPICIVPKGTLSDLSVTYPLRVASKIKTLIDQPDSSEKLDMLKHLGLRDIPNAFWDVENTDVHEALSFDRLHAYIIGLWQKHLLQQLKLLVDGLPREVRVKIEELLSKMPRWPGLAHFNLGILAQDFSDGRKWEDLSKIILHAAYGPIVQHGDEKGYALLRLIRKWIELNALVSLEVQTEKTLTAFNRTLSQFDHRLRDYGNTDGINKDWHAIIKTHSHMHAIRDIRAKGVVGNMDTKPNERLNKEMRMFYQLMTNFKNVEEQLGKLEDRSFVSCTIRAQIDAWDEYQKELKNETDEEGEDIATATSPWQFNQVYLGSRERPTSIQMFTTSTTDGIQALRDPAFHNFKQKLSDCLSDIASREIVSGLISVSVRDEDMITECRYIKPDYESTVSWRLTTDRLRCSPSFHNRKRYDNVLVMLDENTLVFCELVRVFTYTLNGSVYALALVHPFRKPVVTPQTKKVDRHLGICRLRKLERKKSLIVPVRSIIRGCVIAEDSWHKDDFTVVDALDSDLYIRLHSIFPDRDTERVMI